MSGILRDNTQELVDLRWELVKSMLSDFPELRLRAKQLLLEDKKTKRAEKAKADSEIAKLLRKAIGEMHEQRDADRILGAGV